MLTKVIIDLRMKSLPLSIETCKCAGHTIQVLVAKLHKSIKASAFCFAERHAVETYHSYGLFHLNDDIRFPQVEHFSYGFHSLYVLWRAFVTPTPSQCLWESGQSFPRPCRRPPQRSTWVVWTWGHCDEDHLHLVGCVVPSVWGNRVWNSIFVLMKQAYCNICSGSTSL